MWEFIQFAVITGLTIFGVLVLSGHATVVFH